jgi:2-oxoglutarate dehydrogenase E1 component
LQLCAEGNIQVVNATTPAQLFHVLRRQLHRPFRKPLVMMSPKSTLRLKEAASTMEQLATGRFETLIDDPRTPKSPDRILFCSGKVYWALDAEREKQNVRDVAILRVEQLYPFPADEIARALARYAGAKEVFWVQEEPENQGAYTFVRNRLEVLVHQALGKGVQVGYVGRDEAASPAVGSYKLHNDEQAELVRTAFLRPLVPRMPRESLAPKSLA